MTNIKILNHGDYYDPSIGENFASLSDLVSYFYKNPNELKEKNGDWIHLKFPLNFDEPTEVGDCIVLFYSSLVQYSIVSYSIV